MFWAFLASYWKIEIICILLVKIISVATEHSFNHFRDVLCDDWYTWLSTMFPHLSWFLSKIYSLSLAQLASFYPIYWKSEEHLRNIFFWWFRYNNLPKLNHFLRFRKRIDVFEHMENVENFQEISIRFPITLFCDDFNFMRNIHHNIIFASRQFWSHWFIDSFDNRSHPLDLFGCDQTFQSIKITCG